MLAPAVKKLLRRAGFDLARRKPGFGDLLRHHGITTVLDVGANEGQYGAELRDAGFAGDILSFEPIEAVHARLAARAAGDDCWRTFRLALGDADESRAINVSDATVFSSFRDLSSYSAGKFAIARTVRQEEVRIARLDSFLREQPLPLATTYLKIDTQGLEKEVLEGAGERLREVKLVQAELALRQLYAGQDDWLALVHWMEGRGFRVVMAKENGFDHDRVELLELDVVFLNDGL